MSAYATKTGLRGLLLDAVQEAQYPQYGYGLVQATALATRLGVTAVSVVELGVAGGMGSSSSSSSADATPVPPASTCAHTASISSRACRHPATTATRPTSGRTASIGWMRRAAGTPARSPARPRPGAGDRTGLLVLGAAAIGFISFDLDYYSSTCDAFDGLLFGDADRYLPRVVCCFDDTVGPHWEMHSQFSGELLAIDEFNDRSANRKIGKLNGRRYKLLPYEGSWVEGIYVLHLFDHPRYNEYILPAPDRQLELDSGA